jgi:hypothetical protein
MSMHHEDESASSKEIEERLPYQAPRLVSLGSVQALVRNGIELGSDAAGVGDCAFT